MTNPSKLQGAHSPSRNLVLFVIVVAQFLCTSLWFATNAIIPDLQIAYALTERAAGDLTSAIQFGFIIGTLVFALLSISDRFSPSHVFFACSLAGALTNLLMIFSPGFASLIILRALTGFCLAGIYPVGMKISADYFEKGLGTALGFLVGALVLGTAFPHLLRLLTHDLNWKYVVVGTTILAAIGGLLIFTLIPDGPFRKKGSVVDLSLAIRIFKDVKFRSAAFGYFGHMWELYTLWAFVPMIINYYNSIQPDTVNERFWSFLIIASGAAACVAGGYSSIKIGSSKTAFIALLISGTCCLFSFFLFSLSLYSFYVFMLIWGMSVVADSPQFSTLVARYAPKEATGTALTIVNCVGFAITIVSLQAMNFLIESFDFRLVFAFLALGPIFGLLSMRKLLLTE